MFSDKINIDELYHRKREDSLKFIKNYEMILKRIHKKIKKSSDAKVEHCWYRIEPFIFGQTKYKAEECVMYCIKKLQDNGFKIIYTHPNLLYIWWGYWVPDYVREQIKKETGMDIDGKGYKNPPKQQKHAVTFSLEKPKPKPEKDYENTKSYKPSGNSIYNINLLEKIQENCN